MTDKTLLADLIEKHVTRGVVTTFAVEAERIGEELARDILRDREFVERMKVLARAAFEDALRTLHQPAAAADPGKP